MGAGFIGAEFFAKTDKGKFFVQVELPRDASIEQTNIIARKAEAFIRKKPEVTKIITTVGQTSTGTGGFLLLPTRLNWTYNLYQKQSGQTMQVFMLLN